MVDLPKQTAFEAIELATARYAAAKETFESADTRYQAAGRERIDALNQLNEAQKAFDAAVASITKSAPRDSNWSDRERSSP